MEDKIYIGVDPGVNGYITCISSSYSYIKHWPIPKIGDEVDVRKLDMIIKEIKSISTLSHCVLEDVHAIFGASASATFRFGWITGIIEALLVTNSIPFTKVQPKKWQKYCWEGVSVQKKPSSTGKTIVNDTKNTSIMAATRLFPNVDLRDTERCKKPHDGKVDSLLIAYYCSRNF